MGSKKEGLVLKTALSLKAEVLDTSRHSLRQYVWMDYVSVTVSRCIQGEGQGRSQQPGAPLESFCLRRGTGKGVLGGNLTFLTMDQREFWTLVSRQPPPRARNSQLMCLGRQ
jgi:hypothetical protein